MIGPLRDFCAAPANSCGSFVEAALHCMLKRVWVEAIVIALLLLAGIAIRIASMAAANPAVAQALIHSTRLLAPSGTQF